MYEQEKITPYHDGEKASQVEQMFDNIAPTYDKLNHRLSWDIDKGWRRKAIKQLAPFHPKSLLDIATGISTRAGAARPSSSWRPSTPSRCSTLQPAQAISPYFQPKCSSPSALLAPTSARV